jgi:hypothetical protein
MPAKIEQLPEPRPNWAATHEGEVVGVFLKRNDDGTLESGHYLIKDGKPVDVVKWSTRK